jgi:hypothetical protein
MIRYKIRRNSGHFSYNLIQNPSYIESLKIEINKSVIVTVFCCVKLDLLHQGKKTGENIQIYDSGSNRYLKTAE